MQDITIKIENLSKVYALGGKRSGTLRGDLEGTIQNALQRNKTQIEFKALDNVSFEVRQGEVCGIIGKNGAGKSTLLKILSRITKPTSGRAELFGRVSSLLEVGTGFHPDLTGRENIYLNGVILGMTRKEVKEKFDLIVDFSGVEKFIDTPLKRYSSGMQVRLAFAVAAFLESEILIIDEVLAVGDMEFQKKCLGKMEDISKMGRTILFVSHNMTAVRSLCTKGVFLKNGHVALSGSIEKAISEYLSTSKVSETKGIITDSDSVIHTGEAKFKHISFTTVKGESIEQLFFKQEFIVWMDIEFTTPVKDALATILFTSTDGETFAFSAHGEGKYQAMNFDHGRYTLGAKYHNPLMPGDYNVTLSISYLNSGKTIHEVAGVYPFQVNRLSLQSELSYPWETIHGNIELSAKWILQKERKENLSALCSLFQ